MSRQGFRVTSVRGAASIEFALVVVLVVWPAIASILELSQLMMARHALMSAVYEAARAQSRHAEDPPDVRRSLAAGLLPLLGGTPIDERTSMSEISVAWTRSFAETARPDLLQYSVEERINDGVATTHEGARGRRVAILHVTYCRRLFFPPVSWLLPQARSFFTQDIFELGCLARDRWPLRASASFVTADKVTGDKVTGDKSVTLEIVRGVDIDRSSGQVDGGQLTLLP